MIPKDADNRYDDLLSGGVPAASDEFSLEEILAEYGAGEEQRLLRGTRTEEAPPAPPARRSDPAPSVSPPEKLAEDLPPEPKPISLEDVVGSTVDAVMEENREPLLKPRRRWLFSRRPVVEEETEELYQCAPAPEPEPDPEPIGPEPDLLDVSETCRRKNRRLSAPLPAAAAVALLPAILLTAEAYGLELPLWTGQARTQCLLLLGCLAAETLLTWRVFAGAFRQLAHRRCSSELLAVLSAAAAAAD